jgi:hypothetical protein
MTFQLADPGPFMPRGFHHLQVLGRRAMIRACTRRVMATHEDWAIISIQSLPQVEVFFPNVREILHAFLVHHRRLCNRDIKKTHIGQALIRFEHIYDRDNYISLSPLLYGDVTISFTKHNEGRIWRRIEFNWEC